MTHEHVDTILSSERFGSGFETLMGVAVCSCGWRSVPGGRDEVARQFAEHVGPGQALRDLFQEAT